jgi:hypothetical protein
MKVRTPQRIVKLIRYLESVLTNDKAPERLRMQAAERLTELFLETERGKRERQIAALRADARVEAARLLQAGEGIKESSDELTESPDEGVLKLTDAKAQMDAYLQRTIGTK